MLEEGMISRAEHDSAMDAPIKVYPVPGISRETAPYVTEHIRRDLLARYGNERLLRDGLKVYTTVDLERETDAVAATLRGVIEADKRQGYRGPLTHLPQKEWEELVKKETAFLEGEGKNDEEVAALVPAADHDGPAATGPVGPQNRHSPLPASH